MTTSRRPTSRRIWGVLTLALVLFATTLLAVLSLEDSADITPATAPPALRKVTVIPRSPKTAQAEVVVFAQVQPLWRAELRANVSGLVQEVTDNALAGRQVRRGDLLIRIENSALEAEMRSAEQALAKARFALVQAQNKTELARRSADRSGVTSPTDLRLHLPELHIAERAVTTAEAQQTAARRQLAHATITAPFDGYVTAREVSPGQTVAAGDALLTLVDRTRFELVASLSDTQWAQLRQPVTQTPVQIESRDGQPLAQATIRDAGGFRDPETREYKLFVDLPSTNATAPILSGDLVRVVLPGRQIDATLTLPESALTQEGHVWSVDMAGALRRHTAQVLWRRGGKVIIAAPDRAAHYRIVLTPLAGFLPGQRVAPQMAEDA